MYIRLSYDLSEKTPCPKGLWPPKIVHDRDMQDGERSNVYTLTLCNHVGTHVDGPNHFSRSKRPLHRFDINDFVFSSPLVLDIPKGDGEIVTAEDLSAHDGTIQGCDLLLIRTGFGRIRKQDVARYADFSPGFSASAAEYIANEAVNLHAVGIDTLSFAGPQHLQEGIRAHQILLDQCKRDIFLIEDINLDLDLSGLRQVFIVPMFCERIDSAPCTVLALVG